jgi:hypothetical protein
VVLSLIPERLIVAIRSKPSLFRSWRRRQNGGMIRVVVVLLAVPVFAFSPVLGEGESDSALRIYPAKLRGRADDAPPTSS